MIRHGLICVALSAALLLSVPVGAQPAGNCNQPAAEPSVHVAMPGNPFTAVATADGCWVFVTIAGPEPAVAVVKRVGGVATVARVVPIKSGGSGAVLTRDGAILVVAAGPMLAFLDVALLKSGESDPVMGYIDAGAPVGFIFVNVTRDGRWLFASMERAASIAVIDMARVRGAVFDTAAIVGRVPTGNAPVGLEFSSDQRHLFTTAQSARPEWNWPIECKPEGQPSAAPNHTQGALVAIDIAKAKTDAANAVVARVKAGCNPVRLAASQSSAYAYVTARGDNNLVVLDMQKALTDSTNAIVARVPVGTAPVGVTVIENGRTIVVTNSNRFGGGPTDTQPLTVINANRITAGAAAVLGTIPAGAFPRELRVTADGKTLLVTNFNSRTLQLIDIARMPLTAPR